MRIKNEFKLHPTTGGFPGALAPWYVKRFGWRILETSMTEQPTTN